MTIIESLKSLVGYSGSDLDMVFAILAVIIIMFYPPIPAESDTPGNIQN